MNSHTSAIGAGVAFDCFIRDKQTYSDVSKVRVTTEASPQLLLSSGCEHTCAITPRRKYLFGTGPPEFDRSTI